MSTKCTRIGKRTSTADKASYFDDCHEHTISNAAWNIQLDFFKLNIGILFTSLDNGSLDLILKRS